MVIPGSDSYLRKIKWPLKLTCGVYCFSNCPIQTKRSRSYVTGYWWILVKLWSHDYFITGFGHGFGQCSIQWCRPNYFITTHIIPQPIKFAELLGELSDLNTNQSGRSPKVVAFFSATNFSSYIIELLQLHDTIQIEWNYAWIQYNIAIRSHLMI